MNVVDRIDPCPACGRVHGRVSWDGTERRQYDEPVINVWRFFAFLLVGLIMFGAVGAAVVWAWSR